MNCLDDDVMMMSLIYLFSDVRMNEIFVRNIVVWRGRGREEGEGRGRGERGEGRGRESGGGGREK